MLILGLDEAGYGPLLGPLVVGLAALRVAGPATSEDLDERLKGLVRRAGGRAAGGDAVVVDDSKAVHSRLGVAGLARGVRAMARAARLAPPEGLDDLLARFSDGGATSLAREPWYAAGGTTQRAEVPREWAAALRLRGVEPVAIRVAPVGVLDLNDAFDAVRNKGRVLFLTTAALLVAALEAYPGEDVEAVLDRQGGRLDYGPDLAAAFPFYDVVREPAPAGESRYGFRQAGRTVRLRFVTGGDRLSLATGLASMAAKWTRELCMERLNAWFAARCPGLLPTAGYVEDGRRFLADVASVIERESIDRRALVRSR